MNNACDDEAQKDRRAAHARDGLSVDTALGRIVDGVELDCQALDQGHRKEGRDKSRDRHAKVRYEARGGSHESINRQASKEKVKGCHAAKGIADP